MRRNVVVMENIEDNVLNTFHIILQKSWHDIMYQPIAFNKIMWYNNKEVFM